MEWVFFLIPWLIGFLAFTVSPLLGSLWMSFTSYSPGGIANFVGVANYLQMAKDPRLAASVSVTILYVVVSVPLSLIAALVVAVLLNRVTRGAGLLRVVYYIPSLMAGSVAIAIVWRKLFGLGGIASAVLGALGMPDAAKISLIDDPRFALLTLIGLHVWQFGAPMIIFLAGLQSIPPELLDAAALDGCGALRRFRSVTVPMLTPVIFFNLIMGVIGGFQTFTNAYVISDGKGGPVDATLFYALYVYQRAFQDFKFGYASAMAWALLIGIAVVTALLFWSQRHWVHYNE